MNILQITQFFFKGMFRELIDQYMHTYIFHIAR
jgi:hypothetical protein